MKNLSEKTHEINKENTMTEKEMKELFNWFDGEILQGMIDGPSDYSDLTY